MLALVMRIIKHSSLVAYWLAHAETEQPLKTWYAIAKAADWTCMNDVQQAFPKAKVLNGERVRFEVCGGNYRLVVAFFFPAGMAWIKFIGTHEQYDRIDALTVEDY